MRVKQAETECRSREKLVARQVYQCLTAHCEIRMKFPKDICAIDPFASRATHLYNSSSDRVSVISNGGLRFSFVYIGHPLKPSPENTRSAACLHLSSAPQETTCRMVGKSIRSITSARRKKTSSLPPMHHAFQLIGLSLAFL